MPAGKIIEEGLTSDNPIQLICPNCNNNGVSIGGCYEVYCHIHKWVKNNLIVGKWYKTKYRDFTYIIKHTGAPGYWDWHTQLKLKNGA